MILVHVEVVRNIRIATGKRLKTDSQLDIKMTKKEFIKYWYQSSQRDWKVAQLLLKGKSYVHALFFTHLVLEKLCKAHWVKDNTDNYPPKIHNLNKIIAQTKLKLSEDELIFCADMNKFSIEGRYPDYVSDIYKLVTKAYALSYFKLCEKLKKKLQRNLL